MGMNTFAVFTGFECFHLFQMLSCPLLDTRNGVRRYPVVCFGSCEVIDEGGGGP